MTSPEEREERRQARLLAQQAKELAKPLPNFMGWTGKCRDVAVKSNEWTTLDLNLKEDPDYEE